MLIEQVPAADAPGRVTVAASPLDELIDAHRAADRRLGEACSERERVEDAFQEHATKQAVTPRPGVAKSEAGVTAAREGVNRANNEQQAALMRLLHYRPATLVEVTARMNHLIGRDGVWEYSLPEVDEMEALFRSLAGAEVT